MTTTATDQQRGPERFKRHRLDRGWTLDDLADQCEQQGVRRPTKATLGKIERGQSGGRPPLRAVLAKLLDLDVLEDFGWRCDKCGRWNPDNTTHCTGCGA